MAKIKGIVDAAQYLSLGISIVVAIALGVGLGFWLKSLTGYAFFIFVGLAFGIAAAVLNVYKAYKHQLKSMDELKDENRYVSANFKDGKDDE